MIYNRSNSCHHLDNRMRPRHHAAKSHSEANLPKLAFDKHSLKQSHIKIFQTPERGYSVSTLGSVLSICEGMDADCLLDGEAECDNEPGDENDRKPTLHQRQSIISGFSLNSVLSLVEGDCHVRGTSTSGDNPTICTTAPEDGVDNESKGPIENEQSGRNESVIERRGRTTTEERSQTGMVSVYCWTKLICILW